ncbi:MAG TPA: DNA recombination protein RmuC [Candidatus Gracilibacteria bacterium]
MDPLLLVLTCVILLAAINVVFLWLLFARAGKSQNLDQTVTQILEKERTFRQQEQEGLRKEFRDNSQAMQNQFFKSSQVIGELQKELGKMGHVATRIEHLDKLFRAPKARGNMGEESLEEILRTIFPETMWERQYSLGGGIVDAVVKTSNGLIPVDAKFPLPAFEAFVHAQDEDSKGKALKQFHQDLKKRINEVEKYIQPGGGTTHFAILFLPNESVYYEACISVDHIQEYAREKRVLMTGPNTLLYILQMIFKAYQSQTFALKAQEALSQLSSVSHQSQKLEQNLEVLEKHITHAYQKMSEVKQDSNKLQMNIEKVQMLGSGD